MSELSLRQTEDSKDKRIEDPKPFATFTDLSGSESSIDPIVTRHQTERGEQSIARVEFPDWDSRQAFLDVIAGRDPGLRATIKAMLDAKKYPSRVGLVRPRTYRGEILRGDDTEFADTDLYVGGGKGSAEYAQPSYVLVRSDTDEKTLERRLVSAAYVAEENYDSPKE